MGREGIRTCIPSVCPECAALTTRPLRPNYWLKGSIPCQSIRLSIRHVPRCLCWVVRVTRHIAHNCQTPVFAHVHGHRPFPSDVITYRVEHDMMGLRTNTVQQCEMGLRTDIVQHGMMGLRTDIVQHGMIGWRTDTVQHC